MRARAVCAIAGIIALGLGLRLWRLDSVPCGFAEHAIVHHWHLSIPMMERLFEPIDWAVFWREQFAPMSFLSALVFKVAGVSFYSARLASVIVGTVTVALAYGVGWRLRGEPEALALGILTACSSLMLTVSRYADLEHALCPFVTLWALYSFLGVVRGKVLAGVGLGLALGAACYVYAPALVLPPTIAALWLLAIVRGPHRWAIVAGGLIAAPLFWHLASPVLLSALDASRKAGTLCAPGRGVGLLAFDQWAPMLNAELRELFIASADPWYERIGGGAVPVFSAMVAAVGLIVACATPPLARAAVVPALVLAGMVPAVLAPDISVRRLFVTLTALLCAQGLALGAVGRVAGTKARSLILAGALACSMGFLEVRDYFTGAVYAETETGAAYYTALAQDLRTVPPLPFGVVVWPKVPHDDAHLYVRWALYPMVPWSLRPAEEWDRDHSIYTLMEITDMRLAHMRQYPRVRVYAEEALAVHIDQTMRALFPGARERSVSRCGQPVLRVWER